MTGEVLYGVNEWLIALVVLILLLLSAEIGFRAGRRVRSGLSEAAITQVGTLSGAIVGLLALLLAFTFAMALTRYDLRSELVVEEADAIENAYLRSRLLPEPEGSEAAGLLRRYVDVRVDFYGSDIEESKLEQVNEKTRQIHSNLWALVPKALQKDDRQTTTGLFFQSVNDVIGFHSKRLTAMENHIPAGILILLFAVALMTALGVGYGGGVGRNRHPFSIVILCVLVVLVIAVIMDLDRARGGFIRINQDSIVQLRDAMDKDFR